MFCHKNDHLIADCAAWKRKQLGSVPRQPKEVGLIRTVSPGSQPTTPKVPDDCFKPFVFNRYVSLTGESEDQRPVTVLRNTGGSESFILSSVLPLSAESACDMSTVVSNWDEFRAHTRLRVHVKSTLISGFIPVAVLSCFPLDGVDFIMGNDISGGKVYPAP